MGKHAAMCGRFIDPDLRGSEFDFAELRIAPFPRRFNVKPTQDIYVLQGHEITCARWGLIPAWHRGDLKDWRASTINARLEDAATKPSFRAAWRHGRCLVPAGGYYEWTGARSPKQPHFFRSAGNEATLWFAGLLSVWQDLPTCAILTRAANETAADIHDRMPVILDSAGREAWLAGAPCADAGAGYRVRHPPVARFGTGDDGPALIEPCR
jgi:putative SOS response-associated peptidase YedK